LTYPLPFGNVLGITVSCLSLGCWAGERDGVSVGAGDGGTRVRPDAAEWKAGDMEDEDMIGSMSGDMR